MFKDLRGFIEELDKKKLVKHVNGADWNLEIGALTELMVQKKGYTLLFDKIKGYPEGFRIATNLIQAPKQQRISFGYGDHMTDMDIVRDWKEKWNNYKPISPVEVKSVPVQENVLTGDKIDILRFPTPMWHELDGGRYIGTGCMIITKDPDIGYVNLGVYRVMVHDEKTLSFYASVGKHATIMREKYWAQGKDCPVVMVFGQEPVLWTTAAMSLPWGISEFDFTGYLQGEPVEVIKGELTGLPIPSAEIAIEGFSPPPSVDARPEGPFGEWTGYYASGVRPEPVVKIKAIYHRDKPILWGQPPVKPPGNSYIMPAAAAGLLWSKLEKAGQQGIKGVWIYGPSNRVLPVVSLKQTFLGHAKQVATITAGLYSGGALLGRWVIVVDDDIDPSDWEQVVWALTTRCDPGEGVDIVRGYLTSALDPALSPEKRASGNFTAPKVIVNACRPYHWMNKFPIVNACSEETRQQVMAKWSDLFK